MTLLTKIKRFFGEVVKGLLRLSFSSPYMRFMRPLPMLCLRFKYRAVISNVCSMEHYIGQGHDEKDLLIELVQGTSRLICAAPQYDDQPPEMQYFDSPSTYMAILHNVAVLAESNLILTRSGCALNDMMAADTLHRLRFEQTTGFDICDKHNRRVCTLFAKSQPVHIAQGVMLSGNYSFNYYHLTMEIMPRFMDLDAYVPHDVPLLVDQAMLRHYQYVELLNACNTSSRPLIVLQADTQTWVGRLYYPSIASQIAPNLQAGQVLQLSDALFDERSFNWLRATLLPLGSERFFGDNIFLYRNATSRLFNQDEIFEQLEDRGYVKVMAEELSLFEQISLFKNARQIVSGSGAALTNTIYSSPGCRVIVLSSGRYDTSGIFSTIAKFTGAHMRYVDAGVQIDWEHAATIHENFYIDPKRVLNALDEL